MRQANTHVRIEIFNQVKGLAAAIGEDITKERIQIYTERLGKEDPDRVFAALAKCLDECKFFPKLAEILIRINPPIDISGEADEMAGEIIGCIPRFGHWRWDEAREHLGIVAWEVVQRIGGWKQLCEITLDQVPTTRAQLRRIAESITRRAIRGELITYSPIEKREKGFQKLGDIMTESLKVLEGGA